MKKDCEIKYVWIDFRWFEQPNQMHEMYHRVKCTAKKKEYVPNLKHDLKSSECELKSRTGLKVRRQSERLIVRVCVSKKLSH